MANTEVGTAYVAIIPSAKGFAKELQKAIAKEFKGSNLDRMIADALGNTRVRLPIDPVLDGRVDDMDPVDVPVRPDRTALDDLRQAIAQVTANIRATVDTTTLRPDLEAGVDLADNGVTARVGTDVDDTGLFAGLREQVREASRGVVARVRVAFDRERLDVDVRDAIARIKVDRDGNRLGTALASSTASSFGSALQDAIRVPLQSLGNNQVVSSVGGLLGIGLAVAAAPAFGAAFTGALLGGAGLGLIGIGALILKDEPEVKHAATQLMLTVGSVFRSAAIPLIKPLTEALEMIRWAVIAWGPQFRTMFELIAPAIKPLTEGLIGLISNMLPGFTELIREATPFLISLAGELPRLGEYIGQFFRIVDGGGPEASQFFSDLITLVGGLVLAIGVVIRVATEFYPLFRTLIAASPIGMFLGLIKTLYDARDALSEFGAVAWRVIDVFGKSWQVAIAAAKRKGDEVVEFAKGLPGRILRAFGGLGGLLPSVGRSLIQGLINGIRSMVPSLSGTLGWITNMIPNWKGPEDTDRRLLEPTGSSIMGGLIRGIHGERAALEAELGSVTTLIAGTPLTSPTAGFHTPAAADVAPAVPAIRFVGDAPGSFMAWVRENVRTDFEGSADKAFSTVSR